MQSIATPGLCRALLFVALRQRGGGVGMHRILGLNWRNNIE